MCSVLLVEDNVTFRKSLKDILLLRFPAAKVAEAGDGEEALRQIQRSIPDLVFMDIKLPGKNGLELTRAIKKAYPDIEVFVFTSYDIPEYREAALKSGAARFFIKGNAGADDLFEAVSHAFEQKGIDLNGAVQSGEAIAESSS